MTVSGDEAASADDLAHQLQKQCAVMSPMMPAVTHAQLCPSTAGMPANVGISTSEQLRQLLALLSKKNDRQLVLTDEVQNSISKVFILRYLLILT